jgi:hypothetical protein
MSPNSTFEVDPQPDSPGELRVSIAQVPEGHLTLWLPEIIWRDFPDRRELRRPTGKEEAIDTYSVMYMEMLEAWRAVSWERTAAGGLTRELEFSAGRVSASATPADGELLLEVTVANESSQSWRDCWAEVCLRLAPCPSFADTTRRRTLGRVGGEWTALSETPPATLDPTMNIYRATPEVEFVERCIRDWASAALPVQLDHPLIAVANEDDSAVVGLVFDPCAEYCNNLAGDMACIHSDPLLGDLEPGGVATARGKVVYFEGSAAAFTRAVPAARA